MQAPSKPELSDELLRWADWHKAAYGWSPFHKPRCAHCSTEIEWVGVYRCMDCQAMFHPSCLAAHCEESRLAGARKRADEFHWGEPGDPLWEARDAGWGSEILAAYERGRRDALRHG